MIKTPLAWYNLIHEKNRLLVALAGIAFAVMIMFMNLGFLGALSTSASQVYNTMNGDIFLTSSKSIELSTTPPFAIDYLYAVSGVKGVDRVMPLYFSFMQWRNPENLKKRALFAYGVNPDDPAFTFPEYYDPANQAALKRINTILFDRRSRPEFGPQTLGVVTEASQRKIIIGGFYEMGGGFTADATIIMSDQNFRRYFSPRSLSSVNLGLVTLKPGADPQAMMEEFRKILPQSIELFTKQGIAERDRSYWINTTSIGFIFSLGVAVAGIVGIVIVYQVLYTDISEHLRQYATLKALGYSGLFLCQVVLQEALILSVLGYIPGLILSWGFYEFTVKSTAGTLPISMNLGRILFVFGLTIVICSISGLLSVQRVLKADPAKVF